ncbi:hypothetical protein MTR67_026175 [Solanum verrucosum]|uniref:Chromo domain-containing protein n=1 Tax=Solanum verrucosum TaxID=315347 RepID=A0AAF0R4Z5_SOLVR|nr:hypothetical protein MTR67_026175 [Solanum verrucosum]
MRECPKNKQSSGNGGNKAQSSSVALPDRAAPRGATSGTGGGTNRLYAINSRQEEEDSPDYFTDRQARKLRTKEVASVKALWRNQFVEEATWEAEEDMRMRYLYLFETGEVPDQGTNYLLSTLSFIS